MTTTTTASSPSSSSSSCGVYLAPSTIPGGGWGSFAGRDFGRQELVMPGDLIVPLTDLAWNNGYEHGSEEPRNLWDDYYWESSEYVIQCNEKEMCVVVVVVGCQ